MIQKVGAIKMSKPLDPPCKTEECDGTAFKEGLCTYCYACEHEVCWKCLDKYTEREMATGLSICKVCDRKGDDNESRYE